MPHVLNVHLNDRLVGTITNLTSDHNVFTFADSYRDDPGAPVLSLGFYNAERKLVNPSKVPQVRLLPFFANLLPEGHLREYLAQRARVNPVRDFPLLWLTGNDLPGAVIVSHSEGLKTPAEDPDNVVPPDTEKDPTVLKFSLAGVQLKFSAIHEAAGGLTIPVHGRDGRWVLKMPSATYKNVPENEFSMLTFARIVGVDVPETGLIESGSVRNLPPEVRSDLGSALYQRRFDRDGDARIHTEDFNQIYGQYPAQKYENVSYGNMLSGIWNTMGEQATREFIRRLVFTIAIGNGDMHLKNWSVIYPDGRTPQLAPAYDYVSTIVYLPNDKLGLSIAQSKEWSDVSFTQLERFARKAGVPRGVVLEAAREMASQIRAEWPRAKSNLELSGDMVNRIDAHMASIPILNGKTTHAAALTSETASAEPQAEIS